MSHCSLHCAGRKGLRALPLVFALGVGLAPAASHSADAPRSIAVNRTWEVLAAPESGQEREVLARAAEALGPWTIQLAGVPVDGTMLAKIAAARPDEPLVRVAREMLKRPVDVEDLLYFLDDLLAAGAQGLRGQGVWVTSPRARSAGILLHPQEVFGGEPRRYGEATHELNIDEPARPPDLPPAADGDPLGPNWTARFPNPKSEADMLTGLDAARPGSDFGARITKLVEELRAQGAELYVTSTVRRRERGYLMWGAFELSRVKTSADVRRWTDRLGRINRSWGLDVPIRWMHPEGWRATIEAARGMAEAYDVVYATRTGAKTSEHYDGVAVDLTAVGLPAALDLVAPDGATEHFDLSGPAESRDLSLTPALIAWIETHFGFRKLKLDYPHWSDAKPAATASRQPE